MKTKLTALCTVLSLAACDDTPERTQELRENGPIGTLEAGYYLASGSRIIEFTPATAPEKTCVAVNSNAVFCFDKK